MVQPQGGRSRRPGHGDERSGWRAGWRHILHMAGDAYSTVPSAEPGTDGFTIRPPAGTDEARVSIELVESGPDLPEPVSVRGALVLHFRQ